MKWRSIALVPVSLTATAGPVSHRSSTRATRAIDEGCATGAPASDLDDRRRPAGAGHDIGAYEFTG